MSPFAVGAATTDVEALRGHLSAAARAHVPCPPLCKVGPHLFLAFRAGPVLLGDNHRSEGTLGFASCAQEEGSTSKTRGRAPRCSQWAVGRRSTPCPPVALPQPGKISSEPARLSRSQQQPQCLSPKAPARQSPELPTPVRAMSRRDPRFRTKRPAFGLPQPSPHFALPTAGTAALLILFSL